MTTNQGEKMRIGVDIDGCVYPWTQAVNEAVAVQFGIEGLEEHTHWDYLEKKLTQQQWEWIWGTEAAELVFGRLDLIYPGAREVVNALANEHEVHFVTHRHPWRTAAPTARWLSYHFRNYKGVHVLHNSCRKHELGVWDVFIDDKPSTLLEFVENTDSLVLAPDRPWNQDVPGIDGRFYHWDFVPGLITNLKGAAHV